MEKDRINNLTSINKTYRCRYASSFDLYGKITLRWVPSPFCSGVAAARISSSRMGLDMKVYMEQKCSPNQTEPKATLPHKRDSKAPYLPGRGDVALIVRFSCRRLGPSLS
jgi:hypothetical protein